MHHLSPDREMVNTLHYTKILQEISEHFCKDPRTFQDIFRLDLRFGPQQSVELLF